METDTAIISPPRTVDTITCLHIQTETETSNSCSDISFRPGWESGEHIQHRVCISAEGNSVSGSSSQASSQRMLSFRSMSRDASFRSSNSSLNHAGTTWTFHLQFFHHMLSASIRLHTTTLRRSILTRSTPRTP